MREGRLLAAMAAAGALAVAGVAKADDHGETCETATVIVPAGATTLVTGHLDGREDVDTLRFGPAAGRLYRFTYRFFGPSYAGHVRVLDASCATILSDSSSAFGSEPWRFSLITNGEPRNLIVHTDGYEVSGGYELRIDDLGPATDDFPDGPAPAPTIAADGWWVSGRFDHDDDVDVVLIGAAPLDRLRVELEPLNPGAHASMAALAGFEWLGSAFGHAGTGLGLAEPAVLRLVVPENLDGPLHLRLNGAGSGVVERYRVRVVPEGSLAGPDDHSDECAGATPLSADGVAALALIVGQDTDRFSVPVRAGHLYRVAARTLAGELWSVRLDITDGACNEILGYGSVMEYEAGGQGTRFRCNETGAAVIALSRPHDQPVPALVELAVFDEGFVPDDFGATRAHAGVLSTGGSAVLGTLDYRGDLDMFRVTLAPMRLYRLEARGLESGSVAVFSPDGGQVSGGLASTGTVGGWEGADLLPAAGEGGEWFIRLQPSNGVVLYQVRVMDQGPVEVATLPTTCGAGEPRAPGDGPVRVMLRENAPVQWAGFSLAAGRRYRIELGQRTFGGHIAADARWGCEEGLPGADPSGAQWYREEFETGAAGRLDLGLDHSGGSPLVSLTVNVEDAGPATDTVPSDAAGAPVIAQGAGVRQGVVDYVGDADTFRVSLREGVRYRIEAQALAGATNPINVRLAESPTDALGFVRTESGPVGVGRPGPWNGRDGITQRSGDHFVVVYSDFQAVGGYRFRVYPSGCRPDWNDDGATTVDDLLTFLTDWLAGEGEYDGIGFDGGTIDDLLLFVQEWIAGC